MVSAPRSPEIMEGISLQQALSPAVLSTKAVMSGILHPKLPLHNASPLGPLALLGYKGNTVSRTHWRCGVWEVLTTVHLMDVEGIHQP